MLAYVGRNQNLRRGEGFGAWGSRQRRVDETGWRGWGLILCRPLGTWGLDVIRKEAWPFYRTISGVRLCWELEEPKGPKGSGSRIY